MYIDAAQPPPYTADLQRSVSWCPEVKEWASFGVWQVLDVALF